MVMSIANNVQSLNAQRSLTKAQGSLADSMSKMSSGTRISRASDDVAGLGISEKLRGEVRGLNQAARNANDAISMVQTAEGALEEVHSMLQRIRELAVQASNDTLDDGDRGFINKEMQQLKEQINSIAADTEYNGKKLASGDLTVSLDGDTSTAELGMDLATDAGIIAIDVSGAAGGSTFTFTDDNANNVLELSDGTVSQEIGHGTFDVDQDGQTTVTFEELGVTLTFAASADVDGSSIGGDLDGLTLVTVGGGDAATFQTGADADQNIEVNFVNIEINNNAGGQTQSRVEELHDALNTFNADSGRTEAEAIITAVDMTIDFISETRATYGAKQNRLESAVNNLMQTAENLTASESRIRDVDVATESANMARATVLQQAAVSVLSQANQQPQLALKLLG